MGDVFAFQALGHPVNYTNVVTKTWPQEFAGAVCTEPVDVEYLGQLTNKQDHQTFHLHQRKSLCQSIHGSNRQRDSIINNKMSRPIAALTDINSHTTTRWIIRQHAMVNKLVKYSWNLFFSYKLPVVPLQSCNN